MPTNNPITEISLAILSGLLIIAASLLLYTGKIDFAAATVMYGGALALFGGKLALNAPSPSQQELLQQLIDALQPPTPARPITSNAYIPPEIRQQLGVPPRASAQPVMPGPITLTGAAVPGTAIQNTGVFIPTGGNPAFPEVSQQ